jgi:hypothetical protein
MEQEELMLLAAAARFFFNSAHNHHMVMIILYLNLFHNILLLDLFVVQAQRTGTNCSQLFTMNMTRMT